MKGRRIIFLFFLLATACLDPYNPSIKSANYGYLVIDCFINSNTGSGTVSLTRSRPVSSREEFSTVSNATVTVQGDDGSSYTLVESQPGQYNLANAVIDASAKYKLNILVDSKTYASDFVPVIKTPPIDSITWKQPDDKVEIYVNTHGNSDDDRYYRWKYSETWHYTSAFNSEVVFDPATSTVFLRDITDDIYDCYQSYSSSAIITESTNRLTENIVKEYPITSLSISSLKFQSLYSIEVEQYGLSKEGYEYWGLLKKTTENLGSLFDPQPSQVTGNIHCTSNASEPVIGFFNVGTIEKQRIFIPQRDINYPKGTGRPVNEYYAQCTQDSLFLNQLPTFNGGQLLTYPLYKGITLIGYLTSDFSCVDCRLGGGSNIKPDYWP